MFALNESAFTLENPFDGRQNDLPLRYLEHSFASEINSIEFAPAPKFLEKDAMAKDICVTAKTDERGESFSWGCFCRNVDLISTLLRHQFEQMGSHNG